MTYGLFFLDSAGPVQIRRFGSFVDAVAHAKIYYDIRVFSEYGNAAAPSAKFATNGGRLYAINPI